VRKLFEEARINGLILSNRFVRSATFEGMADRQGNCTQKLIRLFAGLARGGTGFDGVQIHAAHGYLHSQFLSPQFNHRRDRYGGSLENRTRAVIETLREIRKSVGPDYPVMIKMNVQDFTANGLTTEESVKVGIMLSDSGIDAIELSGGLLTARRMGPSRIKINSLEKEAYFRSEARAFKKQISVPLILVGGIRSYSIAEKLVRDGTADYVSMSRSLIREPDLINRWKSGNHGNSECDSDNLCFRPAMAGRGIYCVSKERKK
jgi:2,4-dienoyl-CoA reductase-like NADH-dependent reductase (Old Yellow Enzyme family)